MTSLPTPEGFEIPEGTKEGDTFEAMAELRLDAGGRLTLISLEGCDCEMGEDAGPEGEKGKGKSFVSQVEIKIGSAGLD